MKRNYKKPVAEYIDFSYEEQVVATSTSVDGHSDGHQILYCTYRSGGDSNPCSVVVSSDYSVEICNEQAWSLRG